MKVLFIIPFYSGVGVEEHIGIFFHDQALALKKNKMETAILFLEHRSLRQFSLNTLFESHYQIFDSYEDGILTYRCRGWNLFVDSVWGGKLWAYFVSRLFTKYIKKFGKPDIIHAHNAIWSGLAAAKIAKKTTCHLLLQSILLHF